MQVAAMPASPTRPDWQSAHVPRLSFRNSATVDTSQVSSQSAVTVKSHTIAEVPKSAHSETRIKTSSSTSRTAESGNALRSTSSRGYDRSSNNSKSLFSPTTQKKKGLFGGLFVTKEPTALALERLAAQLEAQHGELSARAIPGVSSSKLPEYVPKVNTKWDGVPGALKEREKVHKERARAAKRQSQAPSTRSRSADGSRQANARPGDPRSGQKRNSISTLSSFDSRGRAGHQGQSHYSSSDEVRCPAEASHLDPNRRQRSGKPPSTKSQSLRSPSGSSLPTITAFFPNDIPSSRAGPTWCRSEHSTHTVSSQTTTSTGRSRIDHTDGLPQPMNDTVPEHTSSPIGTPLDRSPVTPSSMAQSHASAEPSILPIWNRSQEAVFVSSAIDLLAPPASATIKRKGKTPRDAFLAGEARPFELPDDEPGPAVLDSDLPLRRSQKSYSKAPELPAHARVLQDLEKRPDSSRARLGLRASMVVRADQAPWERQDNDKSPDDERSTSSRLSMPVVPKRISKVLGKANKEQRQRQAEEPRAKDIH